MTTSACPSYAGYQFPAEVISHAVWFYFRFPLSLRMVDEPLAARGIIVSHETVRQWALKFGQAFANQIRRRLPAANDKWHMDEVVITICGVKHWQSPSSPPPASACAKCGAAPCRYRAVQRQPAPPHPAPHCLA